MLERLICGKTQIQAQNLPKAMKQLTAIDEKHGKSGYEVQFGVRSSVLFLTVITIHEHVYACTDSFVDHFCMLTISLM